MLKVNKKKVVCFLRFLGWLVGSGKWGVEGFKGKVVVMMVSYGNRKKKDIEINVNGVCLNFVLWRRRFS